MFKMKSKLPALTLSLLLVWGQAAFAQTATLLPNARQQFFDNSGKPLSLGSVSFFIPGTTTNKTTWADGNKAAQLPNPVPLDSAGKPSNGSTGVSIYGDGTYRQIVKDRNNIVIWDAVTMSTGGSGGGGTTVGVGDGLRVGTIVPWPGATIPANYLLLYGQAVSRTTYSELFGVLTISVTANCTSGGPTLAGIADTSQISVGAVIEASCAPPGVTVLSKTSSTVTMSQNATTTTSLTAKFFNYGNGDGATTFNLPDYRGLTAVGRNNMGGTSSSKLTTTYYLTNPDALGAIGGLQNHVLVLANLPPYTPTGSVGISDTRTWAINGFSATATQSGGSFAAIANIGGTTSVAVTGGSISGTFTGTAQGGTSTAFSIVQPSITTNYIIKAVSDNPATIGLLVVASSRLVTTAALPANTYNNGTAGVGATLTGNANGALSIDGTAVAVNDIVLIRSEATLANNGIYTVTQAGSGGAPYILTRVSYFNSSLNMLSATYTVITAGVTLSGSSWVSQNSVAVVGTDPVVFNQFSSPTNVNAAGGTIYSNNTNSAGALIATNQPGLTASTAPGTPASGLSAIWFDSTSKNLAVKNDGGVINHGVQTQAAVSKNWIRSIADDGTVAISQPVVGDLQNVNAGTILSNNTNGSGPVVAATQPALAATAAPATPSAGFATLYVDSTSKNFAAINDAGAINHGVQTRTATANNWIRAIADDGSTTISQPGCTNLSDGATGCSNPVGTSGAAIPLLNAANIWSGAQTINASFTVGQDFYRTGVISPTALSGDVNNYNPTGLATASIIRQDGGAADRNITGLSGGGAGRQIGITNIGATNNLVLKNLSGSSSAGNQFGLGADVTLAPGQSAQLWYDNVSSLWRAAATYTVSGGGGGTVTSITPGSGGLVSSITAACSQTAITSSGTLYSSHCVNAQTGTTYTIADGDRAKQITASNAAAQAYSIAQAGAGSAFQSGWYTDIKNLSTTAAGIVTVTPTTSTIDGAASYPIKPGYAVRIVSDGTNYQIAWTVPISSAFTSVANSLGADVALNDTTAFFTGPSVAQGTVGTWDCTGTVTLQNTAQPTNFQTKLWDGTTVIASTETTLSTASGWVTITLSGVLATPVANIKMSAKDTLSTNGKIIFNVTGTSKDSTLTCKRIG